VRNSPGRAVIATFGTKKLAVKFSATNAPTPPLLTQNSCLLRFESFRFQWKNGSKLAREDRYSDFSNKKLAVECSATNAPNPPLLTQNSCLLCFRSFRFRRKNGAKLAQEDRYSDFWNKKLAFKFSAKNAPNPPLLTQHSC
jgi:hypothetical protein